ncbi:MAG: GNAT family N-acetyltransferase [Actinomycetota bacterium]|nr:GNAT family N-acetyltransferase [Actinomycetota bacterium]
MRVEIVAHDWPRFGEVLDLYFDVLYGPFGVAREVEWYHPAHGSHFAVALAEDGGLLGSARLLPTAGDEVRQVRQVVVSPAARRLGVGRELMEAIERIAAEQSARELWLNARESAYGFYSALGWEFSGETLVSELTGVPHREMRKRLEST